MRTRPIHQFRLFLPDATVLVQKMRLKLLYRIVLGSGLLILFNACSNTQGARALHFIGSFNDEARQYPVFKRNFDNSKLMGNVKRVSSVDSIVDSLGNVRLHASIIRAWDRRGVEQEYIIKDSLGNVTASRISELDSAGRLLHRSFKSAKRTSEITSKQTPVEGGILWQYESRDSSSKVYSINFLLTDSGKVEDLKITYPFSHELAYYKSGDDTDKHSKNHSLTVKQKDNRQGLYSVEHSIHEIEGGTQEEFSVFYHSKLYSYDNVKRDSANRVTEITEADDVRGVLQKVKYTYDANGLVSSISIAGNTKKMIYQEGKLSRAEIYDYAGRLRIIIDFTVDDQGNILRSAYSEKDYKTGEFKEFERISYQIEYWD